MIKGATTRHFRASTIRPFAIDFIPPCPEPTLDVASIACYATVLEHPDRELRIVSEATDDKHLFTLPAARVVPVALAFLGRDSVRKPAPGDIDRARQVRELEAGRVAHVDEHSLTPVHAVLDPFLPAHQRRKVGRGDPLFGPEQGNGLRRAAEGDVVQTAGRQAVGRDDGVRGASDAVRASGAQAHGAEGRAREGGEEEQRGRRRWRCGLRIGSGSGSGGGGGGEVGTAVAHGGVDVDGVQRASRDDLDGFERLEHAHDAHDGS